MNTINKVAEFSEAFELPKPAEITMPQFRTAEERNMFGMMVERLARFAETYHNLAKQMGQGNPAWIRMQLMTEELAEFADALHTGDPVAALDALVDLRYVNDGSVITLGLTDLFAEAFDEVHSSNMSKLVDGKPVKNEAGRVVKGRDYRPPDLQAIVSRHQPTALEIPLSCLSSSGF